MAKTGDAETFTLEVYRQIRADVVSGRFEPGARVSPAEIRARFGVSTGVVREALTRLEMHGLLRVEPNRGVYVPSLSLDDLRSLTEARVLNEVAAVRGAVRRGSADWESDLVAAHHRMARLPGDAGWMTRRSNVMVDAHLEFHLQLFAGCENRVLIDICTRLQDSAELYRTWAKSAAARRHGTRDIAAEHRELLDAVLAREEDRAAASYEKHITTTASILLDYASALEHSPDPRSPTSEESSE